jgi:hypothetical protein
MVKASLVWVVPAAIAFVICLVFGLEGGVSLLVSLPLVAISIAGCCGYVGWVYASALKRGA